MWSPRFLSRIDLIFRGSISYNDYANMELISGSVLVDEDKKVEVENDDGETTIDNPDQLDIEGTEANVLLVGQKQKHEKDDKNVKKIAAIVIAVLLATTVGAFFIFGGDSVDDPATAQDSQGEAANNTDQSETTAESVEKEFDQIVYAHAASENSPRNLFTRPATGGDRVDLESTFGSERVSNVDRKGTAYAVLLANGDVYYGTGSAKPTKVFSSVDQVIGLSLDGASNSIAVSTLTDLSTSPVVKTVYRVETDGTKSTFFTESNEENSAIFVENWDGASETLIARRSCYQCDGYNPALIKFDANGSETAINNSGGLSPTSGYEFSDDGTMALYIASSTFSDAEIAEHGLVGGIDEPNGAPFMLVELDIASGTGNVIATIGDITDKKNGTFTWPVMFWADSETGQIPAYAYLTKAFVQANDNSYSNYFESGQGNISSLYAIDDDEILIGSSNADGETIQYFNIEKQEGAIVMETLPTTSILGVTLK